MRILLTTDTVGGVWDHAVTLARGLHDAGHEVLVAALGRPSEPGLAALPPGVQVTARPEPLEWMPGTTRAALAETAAWLADLARVWQADVAHLNQMAYAAFGMPCATVTVVHSDVRSWFRAVRGQDAPPEWDAYTGWVRAGLLASDATAAPTAWQAGQVVRHYDVPAPRVVRNGHPAADLPAPVEGGAPRAPLVLAVGRAWDPAKGMDVLDEALARLGRDAPPAHLLGDLTGPAGESFAPRRLVAHGRVERDAVDAWMGRASVYVAASRYEPFGLAPLEAALAGCALVLADIGTFRELWDGCAEFVPAGDADALAAALRRLTADPALAARLARGAATRARRRFGARRMTAETLALYRDARAAFAAGRGGSDTLAAAS